jgi:hypothetical protein
MVERGAGPGRRPAIKRYSPAIQIQLIRKKRDASNGTALEDIKDFWQ